MALDRPCSLLRFALEAHDLPLARALARALGPPADRELRAMPRLSRARRPDPPLLRAALDLIAGP